MHSVPESPCIAPFSCRALSSSLPARFQVMHLQPGVTNLRIDTSPVKQKHLGSCPLGGQISLTSWYSRALLLPIPRVDRIGSAQSNSQQLHAHMYRFVFPDIPNQRVDWSMFPSFLKVVAWESPIFNNYMTLRIRSGPSKTRVFRVTNPCGVSGPTPAKEGLRILRAYIHPSQQCWCCTSR